jgi:hypothetical protein
VSTELNFVAFQARWAPLEKLPGVERYDKDASTGEMLY